MVRRWRPCPITNWDGACFSPRMCSVPFFCLALLLFQTRELFLKLGQGENAYRRNPFHSPLLNCCSTYAIRGLPEATRRGGTHVTRGCRVLPPAVLPCCGCVHSSHLRCLSPHPLLQIPFNPEKQRSEIKLRLPLVILIFASGALAHFLWTFVRSRQSRSWRANSMGKK